MSYRKLISKALLFLIMFLTIPGYVKGSNDFGIRGLKFKRKKLRTACKKVENAGIGWYRGSILWNQIVDDEGNFDWETLDKQVKKVLNHNIEIMFTLRSVHEIFAPGSKKIDLGYKTIWRAAPPAPEYLEDYKDFVQNVVERYDGDRFFDADFIKRRKNISYWQIENEPGKKPNKGSNFWKGTAQDYTEHFIIAYDLIKEADPNAIVALSGFTWKAIKYYYKYGISFPSEVLRLLSERGKIFDIFDYHFYEEYTKYKRIDELIHSCLINDANFVKIPIWVTETNVDKNKLDPYYTEEDYNRFVAKDIVKRYTVLLHNDVDKVFWFKLTDNKNATWSIPMGPCDFYHFRGLTDSDFNEKPVYYTYKLLIEKTEHFIKKTFWNNKNVWNISYERNGLFIYKFGTHGNAIFIMWYDNPDIEGKEFLIPLPWTQVLITHIITEPDVTEPETEIQSIPYGMLNIYLDDSPVFVEKCRPDYSCVE